MNSIKPLLNRLFFVLLIFLAGCNKKENSRQFSLKTLPPVLLESNGPEIFQYWEFKNASFLWDTSFTPMPSLKLYEDSLQKKLGKDSFALCVKQLAFQDISYQAIKTINGDSTNAQLIHSKKAGKIRPINHLEAQLLEYQISRYPLLSHPTEFHGFILFHDSLNLVRVYFAASDQPWPPKPNIILNAMESDFKKGWTLNYHLHNHYESESNHYLGILAPSMTDVQYYLFLKEEYK